jgi:hypothetical protein
MASAQLIGEIHTVTITDLGTNSLFGALARCEARAPALAITGV